MATPGARLGRYEILARLGGGGMGEVFRARDTQLGRDVAIKALPEPWARDAGRLARFEREARAASALNHPNIVTIHEIGEADGRPYIVMEYVDGPTLREYAAQRPLSPRAVIDLGIQMAEGLAKAHAAGIVHRDLKPENVMVSRDGVVKIVDFGLATPPVGSGSDAIAPSDVETKSGDILTAAGAIIGTVGYMAPEQARGAMVDHRADQFALGAILYEMATGKRAFQRESAVQTLADIIEREPDPIDDMNPAFPASARQAIERCLAKAPAGRFASTQELVGDLRAVREQFRESTVSAATLPAVAPARARRLRAWHALAFVAIVALGVILGPRAWKAGRTWLVGPSLPKSVLVAVLPVRVGPGVGAGSRGLVDYVVANLSQWHSGGGHLSVIPASEVQEAGCKTPRQAVSALGATVAVEIRVDHVEDGVQVTVAVSDAAQQLAGDARTYPALTPQPVFEQVRRALTGQMGERGSARGPAGKGADILYAQALQETPYQQARTAAERFDQEQNLRRAITLYNTAIDSDPNYAAARAGLGEAYLRLYYLTKEADLLGLAQKSLEKALETDDTRPGAWMSLGMLYTIQGHAKKAEEALKQAIGRDASAGTAHRELGIAYERAGMSSKAEAEFREAVRLQPDSWSNHNYLGRFLAGQRRLDEAEREFQAALERVPENARVLANLGGLYLIREQWDQAAKALARAVELNPHSGGALSNLGSLQYSHNGNYGVAADLYARAADASPRDYRVWYNLGLARSAVPSQQAKAPDAYRQAALLIEEELSVDPTNPRLLVRLADCQSVVGDAATARASLRTALAHGAGPEDLRIAAKAEEQLGNRDVAFRYLRQALDAGLPVSAIEGTPVFDQLRKDPRYHALVSAPRVGR